MRLHFATAAALLPALACGFAASTSRLHPRAPAALYSAAGDYQPGWNNIELSTDHTMCLVGSGKGVPLSVEKCSPHFGAFSQVPNDDGTVTLQSQGLCLTGLRDGSVDFATGQPFGLFTCDPAYADFQNFQVSGSYKTDLMLPSSNLCVSAEGANVVAAPCADIPAQNFRFVQSSPPTKPPTPKPAPKPHPKPHLVLVSLPTRDVIPFHILTGIVAPPSNRCGWRSSESCARFRWVGPDDDGR